MTSRVPSACSRLASPFEREFGNAGFVQFAKAILYHEVVLFLGRGGEREVQALLLSQLERNAGIFRGVGSGEKAGMVPVLHVLAVGLEDARVGAGLRENFAEHG